MIPKLRIKNIKKNYYSAVDSPLIIWPMFERHYTLSILKVDV